MFIILGSSYSPMLLFPRFLITVYTNSLISLYSLPHSEQLTRPLLWDFKHAALRINVHSSFYFVVCPPLTVSIHKSVLFLWHSPITLEQTPGCTSVTCFVQWNSMHLCPCCTFSTMTVDLKSFNDVTFFREGFSNSSPLIPVLLQSASSIFPASLSTFPQVTVHQMTQMYTGTRIFGLP